MMHSPLNKRKQQGVALITAVLMVTLATLLATKIGWDAYLDFRRTSSLFAIDQSYQVALGAEAWAADILQSDLNLDKTKTHLAQKWATPLPVVPVDNGEITGFLVDLQGRFNLNNLKTPDAGAPPEQRTKHQQDVEQFKRLLELLQLESMWADRIIDWIDADTVETFPDGGEDNLYSALSPAYVPPNMAITRVSELLSLKEFGRDRYLKIEPHVAALPMGSKINVCTASGELLDSFAYATKVTQYSLTPQVLLQQRGSGCFPDITDLEKNLNGDEKTHAKNSSGMMSEHFLGTIIVAIGTNQFTLYSHLTRNSAGQVRSQLRSFGTN
jgi:general secretion pathway protein K